MSTPQHPGPDFGPPPQPSGFQPGVGTPAPGEQWHVATPGHGTPSPGSPGPAAPAGEWPSPGRSAGSVWSQPPAPEGQTWPGRPAPATPPSSGVRVGWVVGLVAVLVAAVIATVVMADLAGRAGTRTTSAANPPTSASTARTTQPPGATLAPPATRTPSAAPTSLRTLAATPVVPGWVAVASANDRAAYDVPSDWLTEPDVVMGYETKDEVVAARLVSRYRLGSCTTPKGRPGDRGLVGLGQRDDSTDVRARAHELASRWARVMNARYEDSYQFPVTPPVTSDITLMGGTWQAARATTLVELGEPDAYACPARQVRVTVVVGRHPALAKTVSLVIVSPRDVDAPLPDDVEDRIVASFRTTD